MNSEQRKIAAEVVRVRTDIYKSSFKHFIEAAWPLIEPSTPYTPGIHHEAIAEHLQAVTEDKISRLIINTPPRFGKSILISVLWPLWVWTRYPAARFLCTSFKYDLATDFSQKAQRVVYSDWYRWHFGDVVGFDKTCRKTIDVFDNLALGERRLSTYASAMGLGASGHGSLILDDPHSIDGVLSDDVRRRDLEIYDTGLSNRVTNDASIVLACQRLHENDLTGHLVERGGFVHLFLPNEYEKSRHCVTEIGWSDPRSEEGALLWPKVCGPLQTAEKKRSHGTFAYQGQFQQNPVSKTGGLLNPAWFKNYVKTTLPDAFDEHIISVDCAFKGTAKSDYVVFQYWARKNQQYFLMDQVRGQMDFVKTLETFKSFCSLYPQAATKLVESAANGEALISSLRAEISGLIPIKVKDSKESRVSAISPMIESGNCFIPEVASWKEEFLLECRMFPKGKNDDQIDAMSQALLRFRDTAKRTLTYGTHLIW